MDDPDIQYHQLSNEASKPDKIRKRSVASRYPIQQAEGLMEAMKAIQHLDAIVQKGFAQVGEDLRVAKAVADTESEILQDEFLIVREGLNNVARDVGSANAELKTHVLQLAEDLRDRDLSMRQQLTGFLEPCRSMAKDLHDTRVTVQNFNADGGSSNRRMEEVRQTSTALQKLGLSKAGGHMPFSERRRTLEAKIEAQVRTTALLDGSRVSPFAGRN